MSRILSRAFALGLAVFSLDCRSAADEILDPVAHGDYYIFVDKQANQLTLRSMTVPSKVLKAYRAITGATAGDKEKEGDRRTPEGIYFVEGIVPEGMLVPNLHGPAGVFLNYPNPADRIKHQTGSGIWIHGVDSEARLEKRFDTKGCVALGNQDILELKKIVRPGLTPVIIVNSEEGVPGLGYLPPDHPLKARLNEWAKVWSEGSHEEYMKFYNPDFHSRGMDYKMWDSYKRGLKKNYKYIKVTVENLELFKHPKYTVAYFDQIYESDRYQSRGRKRVYFVGPDAEATIVAEESLAMRPGRLNAQN
jgi:murein L,D-transpeptidase YafK